MWLGLSTTLTSVQNWVHFLQAIWLIGDIKAWFLEPPKSWGNFRPSGLVVDQLLEVVMNRDGQFYMFCGEKRMGILCFIS